MTWKVGLYVKLVLKLVKKLSRFNSWFMKLVYNQRRRGARAGASSGDAWEAEVQGRIYEEVGRLYFGELPFFSTIHFSLLIFLLYERLGPAMLEQKRSMLAKAKQPSTKRSMVKLKRMLTECLMEKNILDGRGGAGGIHFKFWIEFKWTFNLKSNKRSDVGGIDLPF